MFGYILPIRPEVPRGPICTDFGADVGALLR